MGEDSLVSVPRHCLFPFALTPRCETKMSSALQEVGLYSPLDSNRDEIRLLTITNSPVASDLDHCWIEPVSLQDIRCDDAAAFVAPSIAAGPQRKPIPRRGARHHGIAKARTPSYKVWPRN